MHLLFLLAASVSCPALDGATVAGAYGEVQVTVTHLEKSSDYTCRFARSDSELTLEVKALGSEKQFAGLKERACQSGQETAIKGIGNEAVACGGTIVGRVRDRGFVLSLSSKDKGVVEKSVRSKNTALAEQVAGNLF